MGEARNWGVLPAWGLALPFLAAALFLRGPWAPDELRLLQVAAEMEARDAWLVPTLLGETYTHKPPLILWGIRLLGRAGLDPWWASRGLAALCALGSLWCFHRLARAWRPEWAGHLAAALAVSPLFLVLGQMGGYDSPLLLSILAGLALGARSPRAWLGPALAAGAGVLVKGPVALLYLAVLTAALRLALWGPRALRPTWRLGGWALVVLAVVGAWFVPFARAVGGGSWWESLVSQTAGRISGEKGFGHAQPFWFYVPWLPLLLLPWPWTLLRGLPPREGGPPWSRGEKAVGAAALLLLLCFSLLSTKAIHYLLPLLPWTLLLLPRALDDLGWEDARWLLWLALPAGAAGVLLATGILNGLLELACPGLPETLAPLRLPAGAAGLLLLFMPLLRNRLHPALPLALLWLLLAAGALPLLDRFQLPHGLMARVAAAPPRALLVVGETYGGALTWLAGRAGLKPPPPELLGAFREHPLRGGGAPGVAAPVLSDLDRSLQRELLLRFLRQPDTRALLRDRHWERLGLEGTGLAVRDRGYFRGSPLLLVGWR